MDAGRSASSWSVAGHLGFWSAGVLSLTGIVYIAVVGWSIALRGLVMPPTGTVQLFGGVITLLDAQLLIILMASIHVTTPVPMRILSLLALIFTVLFAGMVSINRFVQLSVVRQRLAAGDAEGVSWFLAYGPHSAMLSLEILGWGMFLGIACLFAAPLFAGGKLERDIRLLFLLYGILGLLTAVGFVLGSPIAAVGMVAWGIVLPLTTMLLTILFRRAL